jgi:hypothetical protein
MVGTNHAHILSRDSPCRKFQYADPIFDYRSNYFRDQSLFTAFRGIVNNINTCNAAPNNYCLSMSMAWQNSVNPAIIRRTEILISLAIGMVLLGLGIFLKKSKPEEPSSETEQEEFRYPEFN